MIDYFHFQRLFKATNGTKTKLRNFRELIFVFGTI